MCWQCLIFIFDLIVKILRHETCFLSVPSFLCCYAVIQTVEDITEISHLTLLCRIAQQIAS